MDVRSRIGILIEAQNARRAEREIDGVAKSTGRLRDESERFTKQNDESTTSTNRFEKSLRDLRKSLGGKLLKDLQGLVMPAAKIAAIGLGAQAVSGLAAGVIGLGAGIGPAAGALAVVPALALTAGQGLGVFKLATQGVSGVVGGLNDRLDTSSKKFQHLTVPAQGFARSLEALKPRIRSLQSSVQRGLFPGLTDGLHAAAPAINALRGPLTGTAHVLGNLGRAAGQLVGSKGFLRDLSDQAKFNTVQIARLGSGGLALANALRNVIVVARPLTSWLVQLAAGWMHSAGAAAQAGRESGRLAAFFDKTRVVISHLFSIAGALARTLFNVGRAGQALGGSLLRSLDRGAEAMARWSASARGQSQLREFFARAKPVIFQVAGLIGDVTKAFLKLSQGKTVAPLIADLRKLVPVISSVLASTTAAMGPGLVKTIVALAQAFQPLAGASGPLVLLVDLLGAFARAAVWIEQSVPGASTALSVFFGALAVTKAVGLASFASDIFGSGRGLAAMKTAFGGATTAMRAFSMTTIGTRIGLAALKVQEIAVGVASKAWAAAQWLVNAALTANPIGLAVVALVALGVAFVVAYRKIGFFRRAVNSVWSFIKGHWPLLLGILTGPIGLAVVFIVRHFSQIVRAVKGLPGKIAGAAKGMFDGIKDAFRDAINFVINGWNGLHFSIPGFDPPGPGPKFGGVNIGVPHIPTLAKGGTVSGAGSWITGEAGPELNTSDGSGHVRVQPLTDADRVGARGLGDAHVTIETPVYFDGAKVAHAVRKHSLRELARTSPAPA